MCALWTKETKRQEKKRGRIGDGAPGISAGTPVRMCLSGRAGHSVGPSIRGSKYRIHWPDRISLRWGKGSYCGSWCPTCSPGRLHTATGAGAGAAAAAAKTKKHVVRRRQEKQGKVETWNSILYPSSNSSWALSLSSFLRLSMAQDITSSAGCSSNYT